jgi:hypothetical protein
MRGLLKLVLVLPFLSFAALAQDVTPDAPPDVTVAQTPSVNQDMAAADPQDPFVRGLKRLDEKLRLQREAEELARRAMELQREAERRAEQEAMGVELDEEVLVEEEVIIPAPISDPDFFTAFAARQYRLDGLVLSRPQSQPTIHVLEEVRKPIGGELFWSGRERRWVYLRRKGETLSSIARKLVMQKADILAMNNALRENQLPDPVRFYVSPRDNGPLTHIILRSDTLEKLAKIYDTDVPRLRVRNQLGDGDKLVLGRRFLIREKAIDDRLARMAVPKPQKIDDSKLSMARQPYARLGQFADEKKAMRGAREFYAKYYEFMDSDISLRRERDDAQKGKLFFNMDIGPLRSERHGEAYCALFRKDEMPCIVVYRVPGPERARNFDSQAIISVSPYVYFDGDDELDSGRTDVPRLTKLEYFLTEGQELGNADGTIAKITNDRIMLTDANGYLLTLPLNRVPEVDPEEKRRAAEAARQAAMQKAAEAAGAAANAAGNVEVDVPGPEDTALGQRLQGNEAKRREGSQGFIKALAEKPKKLDEK